MNKQLCLLVSLAILSLANLSRATTLYWDGGTSNISTNGDGISQGGAGIWDTTIQNWDPGVDLAHTNWDNTLNYDAVIASPSGVVTVNTPITANSLTLNGNGYTIWDGANPANTLTVSTVTNNTTTQTYLGANVVCSSFSVYSTNSGGSLILTNTHPQLNGPITVAGGILQLGLVTAGFTGPLNFGDVTVSNSAMLKFSPGAAETYNQTVSGPGSVYVQATGYGTTVYLAGANTFTGPIWIDQAALKVAFISDTVGNGLGLGTNVYLCRANSRTDFNYVGYGDTTTRTLTLGGGAASKQLQSNGYGPLAWMGPVGFLDSKKQTLTLAGSSSYMNVFGGTIPDNYNNPAPTNTTGLIKTGSAVWQLAGTNTYSGGTTLSQGTLLITNDFALGAATGAVYFAGGTLRSISNDVTLGVSRTVSGISGGVVNFQPYDINNFNVASFITGTGAVAKVSSSYTLGNVRFSNDTNNFTGDFSASSGNTEFTSVADQGTPSSLGVGAAATGGRITLNNTGAGVLRYVGTGNCATHRPLYWTATASIGNYALDNTNTGTIAYLSTSPLVISNASRPLFLQGSNTGTNTLAQPISNDATNGAISVAKSGVGKWVLSGANTYGGPTAVNGGTLLVNGYAAGATNTVTVASGATLGGTGTIGGAVTFNAGSHAVFTSGAIFAMTNSLTIDNSGTFPDVHLSLSNNVPAGTYTLATYNTSGSSGAFNSAPVVDSGSFAAGTTNYITTDGGQVNLVVLGGASGTLYPPVLSGICASSGGVILSFCGTNAQTYHVLTSTNVTAPLTNWTSVCDGTFGASPVCYTNVTPVDPHRFYRITSP